MDHSLFNCKTKTYMTYRINPRIEPPRPPFCWTIRAASYCGIAEGGGILLQITVGGAIRSRQPTMTMTSAPFPPRSRTNCALGIWISHLSAIPYSNRAIGASTALNHKIARKVLGMDEPTWRRVLEGEARTRSTLLHSMHCESMKVLGMDEPTWRRVSEGEARTRTLLHSMHCESMKLFQYFVRLILLFLIITFSPILTSSNGSSILLGQRNSGPR